MTASFDDVVSKVEKGRTNIPECLHQDCENCIKWARKKYNNFMSDNGTFYEDGFGIKCNFIPHDESFIHPEIGSQLPPKDLEEFNSRKSALLWGEKFLIDPDGGRPWKAWPFQRGPLLCSSSRKVYRFGRRCLPAGTPILMGDGNWKSIETIRPGEYVASRDSKAQFVQKRILNFWDNGEKEVYRITLSNGMWVDCTSNHPLLACVLSDETDNKGILEKWISIEDGLKIGTKVAILNQFNRWGKESYKEFNSFLNLDVINETLPSGISNWDKESTMLFINCLFSRDGKFQCYQRKEKFEVEANLFSVSKKLLDQIRLLLLKIGVVGYINKDEDSNEEEGYIQHWKLQISSRNSLYNFFKYVGLIYGKENYCLEILSALKSKTNDLGEAFKYQKFVSICSIKYIGIQPTYDIEVEDTHNFVSNGICTHNTGKCLPYMSDIQLADGSICKIGDLVGKQIKVHSLDPETYKFVPAKAYVFDNGLKPCIKVSTKYGQQIECTLNHPLLTCEGWKSFDTGLNTGDRIAVPRSNPNIGTKKFNKNLLSLLGYLLGKDSFHLENNSVDFTISANCNDVKDSFLSLLDGTYHINNKRDNNCYNIRLHTNNSIVPLIREIGLINCDSHTKFIPDFIYNLDREHLIEFLWPLFTMDGLCDNQGNIGYRSTSKNLSIGVRRLLSRLGIVASTRIKTLKSGEYAGNQYYVTEINNNLQVAKFLEIVGLRFRKYEGNHVISRDSDNSQLREIPTSLYWDEIVSVEYIGEQHTAGLHVPGYENYINDVIEHNSTILAVEILWYLFTAGGGTVRDPVTKKIRTNLKVLLLAPQKSHVENIFDRVRAFLAVSPALGPCIDRNKRGSPQVITLVTKSDVGGGSAVTGFSSGDSSGSNGLSARGQDADLIILDEGAFISSKAIKEVVLAILYTRPTTGFIISSTPSGTANDYFESICTKRPDFAEFYVPATKRPDWDLVAEQMEKEFGSNQEQYDKEVLAAFSPAGVGVYRDDLVRFAQTDYSYGGMGHNPAFIYTMGVDWNKEHGTEIVIVGTHRIKPHVSYIVCSENIPKKENTSPRGISRIVELNQIWQPAWIYVDAGGGDGGQMLRHHGRLKIGKNLIEARLKDSVKDFDFGSKIEIMEHDGKKKKVPSKQFMVENSVKKFELGEIKFPREDLNLQRQLDNYIVARRTLAGTPIYATKEAKWGDHTLDALNLALVAVRLEFPSFQHAGIVPLAAPIAFIPNKESRESKQRIILPMAAESSTISGSRTPKHRFHHPTVVKYWGVEPSEEAIQKQKQGFLFGQKRRFYGR